MFCKLALVIMLCVALQEVMLYTMHNLEKYFPTFISQADAACPSSISDQFTTVASSASEAAKKAACTALDVIIKNVPATGAGSIEKADLDDCMKKFEETNKYEKTKIV